MANFDGVDKKDEREVRDSVIIIIIIMIINAIIYIYIYIFE